MNGIGSGLWWTPPQRAGKVTVDVSTWTRLAEVEAFAGEYHQGDIAAAIRTLVNHGLSTW